LKLTVTTEIGTGLRINFTNKTVKKINTA